MDPIVASAVQFLSFFLCFFATDAITFVLLGNCCQKEKIVVQNFLRFFFLKAAGNKLAAISYKRS